MAEVKFCARILSAMKLNLPLQLNLVQNLQYMRATKPCFSAEAFKAIYSVFIFFDGWNICLKRKVVLLATGIVVRHLIHGNS